jgi:hypothetical protein
MVFSDFIKNLNWQRARDSGIMPDLLHYTGGTMGLFDKVLGLFKAEEDARPAALPGRNEPCWCGSGKKYKKCHQSEDDERAAKSYSINCGPT